MPRSSQNPDRLPRLFRRVGRDPRIPRPPRPHDEVERTHGLFQRRLGVEAVRIEDIDVIDPHPPQRLVARGDQVLAAAPLTIGPRPHAIARLGRQHQFVAIPRKVRRQDLSERLLGAARRRAVVVRQVEMRDAQIESRPAHRAFDVVGRVAAEVVPEAKADRRQLQTPKRRNGDTPSDHSGRRRACSGAWKRGLSCDQTSDRPEAKSIARALLLLSRNTPGSPGGRRDGAAPLRPQSKRASRISRNGCLCPLPFVTIRRA